MIATSHHPRPTADARYDERFLQLIPAIERYARSAFRHLHRQAREEAICAVVAEAFCAFRRLAELGKQDVAYAAPLARFAVARHRYGRRVGSKLNSLDIYALAAQRRRGFCLQSMPTEATSSTWAEILADDTLTPIPDQVAFRLDLPAWLRGLNRRDRKLAKFLALGNTTGEAAQQFQVSKARVSQLRRELQVSWQAFQGEVPQEAAFEMRSIA